MKKIINSEYRIGDRVIIPVIQTFDNEDPAWNSAYKLFKLKNGKVPYYDRIRTLVVEIDAIIITKDKGEEITDDNEDGIKYQTTFIYQVFRNAKQDISSEYKYTIVFTANDVYTSRQAFEEQFGIKL